jgi:hypothetical protein
MGHYDRNMIAGNIFPTIFTDTNPDNILTRFAPKNGFDFIKQSKKLINTLHITTNLYKINNSYYLEKKNKTATGLNTNYCKIIHSNIIGTGNMSSTLIMNVIYVYEFDNKRQIKNTIIKAYPFNQQKLYDFFNGVKTSDTKLEGLSNLCKYVFVREALMGCWVNLNLKKPRNSTLPVTHTIMTVNDAYFVNGKEIINGDIRDCESIPINYNDYIDIIKLDTPINPNDRKFKKSSLRDYNDNKISWGNVLGNVQYGYIEMEQAKYTMNDVINKYPQLFDYEMFFEIIYTQIALLFFGNVSCTDDHADNIMVADSDKVRKYRITKFGKEYVFYVANNLQIKYIDLERFRRPINRNLLSKSLFCNYYIQEYYNSIYDASSDSETVKYTINNIYSNYRDQTVTNATHRSNYIDIILEILLKMAPNRMKNFDLSTNTKEIVEFHLNLDLPDADISKDFLFAMQPEDIGTYPLKRRYIPQLKTLPQVLPPVLQQQKPTPAPRPVQPPRVGGNLKLYKLNIS